MTTCPVCRKSLAIHTDADCLQRQAQQAEVARVILRDRLAMPYRQFATGGQTIVIAISMTPTQYEALKQFAEE